MKWATPRKQSTRKTVKFALAWSCDDPAFGDFNGPLAEQSSSDDEFLDVIDVEDAERRLRDHRDKKVSLEDLRNELGL